MNKKNLIEGKLYNVQLQNNDHKSRLYFLEQVEGYDHSCECCGKQTMNGFVFVEEYYKNDYQKSWESGTYFVGGTSCLKKFVSEI